MIYLISLMMSQAFAGHWYNYNPSPQPSYNYETPERPSNIRYESNYGGGVDVRVNNERAATCYRNYTGDMICR